VPGNAREAGKSRQEQACQNRFVHEGGARVASRLLSSLYFISFPCRRRLFVCSVPGPGRKEPAVDDAGGRSASALTCLGKRDSQLPDTRKHHMMGPASPGHLGSLEFHLSEQSLPHLDRPCLPYAYSSSRRARHARISLEHETPELRVRRARRRHQRASASPKNKEKRKTFTTNLAPPVNRRPTATLKHDGTAPARRLFPCPGWQSLCGRLSGWLSRPGPPVTKRPPLHSFGPSDVA